MVKSSSDKVMIGTGNWTTFSKRSGQRRNGKIREEKCANNNQKQDRWWKSFTTEEEELVIQLHSAIGSRWMIIAQQLPGRTENEVKMLWNTKLRKRLSAMGIDPVTHKPFSQILADYGNIGAFPKARTRFANVKNAPEFRPAQIATPSPLHPGLYSQLQVINLFTQATTKTENRQEEQNFVLERASSLDSQEISSFSWRDFLIDEAPPPPPPPREYVEGKERCVGDEEKNGGILLGGNNGFEGCCSSSNATSFVDAMIERSQDQIFTLFPALSEESFHY